MRFSAGGWRHIQALQTPNSAAPFWIYRAKRAVTND
jgi:hypothetical protein